VSCACRKVAFDSQRSARNFAKRRHGEIGGTKAVPYRCPGDGKLWHLTDHRGAKKRQFR
jgi:hypothetical protein